MPPIIYNINNAVIREKMIAFDYDWTIVCPTNGKTFPSSVSDWQWLYPTIPEKIKRYYNDGYMIVIFTNQSKTWKCEQIQHVAELLETPIFVIIATEKCDYKPNQVLFNVLCDPAIINKEVSFFVGDALGRKTDFSDSDKQFANAIGIPCFSPESVFDNQDKPIELPIIQLSDQPEIIIMVGYPGSGKSTIAKNICENKNYIHICGDVYKTSSKMIKASIEHILQKKSIVFDATNSSIKKRKEYIELANKYKYNVKCIHVSTSLEESFRRNKSRISDQQVPKIAYSIYSKHYEKPTEDEGFVLNDI